MTRATSESTANTAVQQSEWPAPARILVAVDGSPQSGWADKMAEALGAGFRADIRLVHVWDPETQAGEVGERVRAGEQFLADFPAGRLPAGKRLDRVFRIGSPVREIVSAANDWAADLIAIGTHARKGIDHLLLAASPKVCSGGRLVRCCA